MKKVYAYDKTHVAVLTVSGNKYMTNVSIERRKKVYTDQEILAGSAEEIFDTKCFTTTTASVGTLGGNAFRQIKGATPNWSDVAFAPDGTIWAVSKN